MKSLSLLFLVLAVTQSHAQRFGEVYGLEFRTSQLRLAKVNPLSGGLTLVSSSPTSSDQFGSGISDVDPVNKRYHYVRAGQIITVDMSNGQVLYNPSISCSTHSFNFTQPISNIAFNWADGLIYGLLHKGSQLWFAKVDPVSGVMTVLSSGPISSDQYQSGVSDIDPINGRYFYIRGGSIITVDIATATVLRNQLMTNPNNALSPITNIAYDWLTDQIFGLNYVGSKWDNNGFTTKPAELRLATVDPISGVITLISPGVISADQFQSGVSDIDPVAGLYYYIKAGQILSVDLSSGLVAGQSLISNPNQAISPITNIEVVKDYQSAPIPSAEFVAVNEDLDVQYKNLSSFSLHAHWDFGDGNSSSERHPRHSYQTRGIYEVSLSSTNAQGEQVHHSETITVLGRTSDDCLVQFAPHQVYPNPSSGRITVETPEINNYRYFECFDESGTRVVSLELFGTENKLVLPDLEEGEYQYRIKSMVGKHIEGVLVIE